MINSIKFIPTIKPPSWQEIGKQIDYGTAVGLTKTAKEGQKADQDAAKEHFTLRGNWIEQSNKFGIKVKPATRTDQVAEVRTNADWLEKQKKGGEITTRERRIFFYNYGGVRYIAEPSRALRPKGSTKKIDKSLWPSRLRKKKSTFVIISRKKNIPIVMTRFAEGKDGVEAMYILRPNLRIKSTDAFDAPIDKIVKANLDRNIKFEIQKAFATMK